VARRNAVLFLVYSAGFHIGLLGMLDVLVNFYFVSLGYQPDTIGLLQSLPRLAGFITSLPIGLLTNRIGTRRMLIISTIGCALALILQLVPVLPMLVLSRFLFGLCYGAQQIATSPQMIGMVEPGDRTRFFALHNGISMATMGIGSFMGGVVPGWIVGLSGSFVPAEWVSSATTPYAYGAATAVAAFMGLLCVLPLLWLPDVRPAEHEAAREKRSAAGGGIPWRLLVWLSVPMITFGFTGGLTFPFFNLFWRTQFGLPDQNVGAILSIGWIGMGIIPLFGSALEKRFGRAGGLGVTLTVATVAFFGLGLLPALPISIAFFVLAISFRNTMQPLFQPLVLDTLPPHLHNVISSVNMVMWNVGWFAATAMAGVLQTRLGFGVMMHIVAVGVAITAVLVVAIFRRRELELKQSFAGG
jgi:predicted MFS family arabinose efflux permease